MRFLKFSIIFTLLFSVKAALAESVSDNLQIIGKPIPHGLGFQPAVTEMARDLQWLDNFLLVIVTVITLFVTFLLVYAIVKFNRARNPEPATKAPFLPKLV